MTDDKIIPWADVQPGDLVLLDDCLITAERVEVVQKPWGDGTTFPAVDISHRLENGHLVTSERHGERFTAVRRPAAGPTRDELLDALKAVLEAITIPHPATVGDEPVHDRILNARVIDAVVMVQGILERLERGYDAGVPWSVAYLRERLAEHPPVGYRTWNEAVEATWAAKRAEDPDLPGAGEVTS